MRVEVSRGKFENYSKSQIDGEESALSACCSQPSLAQLVGGDVIRTSVRRFENFSKCLRVEVSRGKFENYSKSQIDSKAESKVLAGCSQQPSLAQLVGGDVIRTSVRRFENFSKSQIDSKAESKVLAGCSQQPSLAQLVGGDVSRISVRKD